MLLFSEVEDRDNKHGGKMIRGNNNLTIIIIKLCLTSKSHYKHQKIFLLSKG